MIDTPVTFKDPMTKFTETKGCDYRHTLLIEKGCEMFNSKKRLLSAISALPDDAHDMALVSRMDKPIHFSLNFSSAQLGNWPKEFILCKEINFVLKPNN